jgi:chemotaxis signal transduction protein
MNANGQHDQWLPTEGEPSAEIEHYLPSQRDDRGPCKYIIFRLDCHLLAIELLKTSDILRLQAIRPTHRHCCGAAGYVEYRDQALPVIDLSARISPACTVTDRARRIIVIQMEGSRGMQDAGLPADEILDVYESLLYPADFASGGQYEGEYFCGEFVVGHKVVRVLDADQLTRREALDCI